MKTIRASVLLSAAITAIAWSSLAHAEETKKPATATTSTTSARYMPSYEEPVTPPPNRAMLIGGAVVFGAAYIPSAVVAAYSSNDADKNLWFPMIGPWIDLADRQCSGVCGSADNWNAVGIVLSGAAQTAGVALMLASLFVPEKLPAPTARTKPSKPEIGIAPFFRNATGGIAAAGTF